MDIAIVQRSVESGRVVYIPEVVPVGDVFSSKEVHYPLPKNWTDLLENVRWAAGGQLTLEVDAPPTVTTELTRSSDGDRYFIHLLNFSETAPVDEIEVRLRVPDSRSVASVEMLAPGSEAILLEPTSADGVMKCAVESLETYAVLRVSLA